MKYHLDTNTCIYFLNDTAPLVAQRLRTLGPEDVAVSSMVKAELLCGAEKSRNRAANLDAVTNFLDAFEIVPFCTEAAAAHAGIRAVLQRKGQPIGPNDLIIAATALAHTAILVTNNVREFKRVPGLGLENWAEELARREGNSRRNG